MTLTFNEETLLPYLIWDFIHDYTLLDIDYVYDYDLKLFTLKWHYELSNNDNLDHCCS